MRNNLSLIQAIEKLQTKDISPSELVSDSIDQINKFNKKFNVFLTLNDKAKSEADAIKGVPNKNKPLLGIPFAIKDNFLTKGIRTTASSKVLENYIPVYDATVVRKLKEAGAIILGKTNMDAWAHGSSTETSDFGSTKNPWDETRLPGGSSGGSAAAVSADMCVFAIGSETAGSVRGPASWCGIVGLKPTYGRVSRYGVIAMGSSLDSPGPMTKSVADAKLVLSVIEGKDEYDATSYVKTTPKSKGKKGKLKIGIAKEYLIKEIDENVKSSVIEAGKVFERLGHHVEYVSTLDPRYAIGVYTVVQRSEVSSNLARYDAVRYGNGREFFGEEAKRRISLGTFTLSAGYSDRYYKKAQKVRTLYINDFENIFKNYDLLIGPSMPGIAPKIGVTKGASMFGELADVLNEPSSISGLPGISVPCGVMNNMPLGLNIFGPQYSDDLVLHAAQIFEDATNWKNMRPNI